jgi:hypothetical protein
MRLDPLLDSAFVLALLLLAVLLFIVHRQRLP